MSTGRPGSTGGQLRKVSIQSSIVALNARGGRKPSMRMAPKKWPMPVDSPSSSARSALLLPPAGSSSALLLLAKVA